jgi:asparagine synthase (glutamine-hydrolysing)
MCGIAGILYFDTSRQVDEHKLTTMRDALLHRGPDAGGNFIENNIGLGHRRLSILDLSVLGNQPMFSADDRYVIVYNGEIYNFRDLRQELISKGYSFRSNCDTEVLLSMYVVYGEDMLDKLNGMFAFVIWDRKEKSLFAARDRVGIKPFYYVFDAEQFLFSSEAKSFFAAGYPLQLEEDSFSELILYRFVSGEETLFKNVKKLLPGHSIKINAAGNFKVKRWWHLGEKIARHDKISNPLEWFRNTFNSSIKNHMISDVPVGVLLSGGLDSSSICASLHQQNFKSIQTFNVGFKDFEDDESNLAKRLSYHYDYPFHSIHVENKELEENLELANFIHDEPLIHQNDPQIVAISRYAKKFVTVLLSGEGADEFLGGYVRYKPLQFAQHAKLVKTLLSLTPSSIKNRRIKKLERYFNLPGTDDILLLNASNNFPEELKEIGFRLGEIKNDYRNRMLKEAKEVYPNNIRRQALYLDQHTYLSSLNHRNDRATMAASIECRVPFLDHRLMEGLGTLDDKWLFSGKKSKYILKKSFEPTLPSFITEFRKIGFSVPWLSFIHKSERLNDYWNNMENSELLQYKIFSGVDLRSLRKSADEGNMGSQMLLRQLFFSSIWWKEYVEHFKTIPVYA